MTSGGKPKPAKAERALGAGRGGAFSCRQSGYSKAVTVNATACPRTILVLSGVATWEAAERFPSSLAIVDRWLVWSTGLV